MNKGARMSSGEDLWFMHAGALFRDGAVLSRVASAIQDGRPDLRAFDVVVVSHHAFATQAVFATDAPVLAYVHSPARWAWDTSMRAQEAGKGKCCRTCGAGPSST